MSGLETGSWKAPPGRRHGNPPAQHPSVWQLHPSGASDLVATVAGMSPREPANSADTVRAWGMADDAGEDLTRLIPVVPASGGRTRQVWIIGVTVAAGVAVLIALGFLLLGPQKPTTPPLVPITSMTTPSVSSSPSPVPTETVTQTVTATSYVPVPATTSATAAPPSSTPTDPNDVWKTCHQMHPHRWCNGYR